MGGWVPLIVGFVIIGLCAGVSIVLPSSPNRDLFKVCWILTLTCCYLMWAFTYLAQMNPITNPIRKLGT